MTLWLCVSLSVLAERRTATEQCRGWGAQTEANGCDLVASWSSLNTRHAEAPALRSSMAVAGRVSCALLATRWRQSTGYSSGPPWLLVRSIWGGCRGFWLHPSSCLRANPFLVVATIQSLNPHQKMFVELIPVLVPQPLPRFAHLYLPGEALGL